LINKRRSIMRVILLVVAGLILAVPGMAADFNGDGIGDPAIFRPETGMWAVRGITRFYYGQSGDSTVTDDFNGDGTDDPGIYRNGLWAIRNITRFYYGGNQDNTIGGNAAAWISVRGTGNLFAGKNTGTALTSGYNNSILGTSAAHDLTSGFDNTSIGRSSGFYLTGGYSNVLVGYGTGGGLKTGGCNTFIGTRAGQVPTPGSKEKNTVVGYQAGGFACGDSNIYLGFEAGFWETGDDKFFIDNRRRSSEADGRVKALIYGVMADTTNDQELTINGYLTAREALGIISQDGDPDKPAEGESIIWGSAGNNGIGDNGDIIAASTVNGVTRYKVIFDFSEGTIW
jgi:hypothetical protein